MYKFLNRFWKSSSSQEIYHLLLSIGLIGLTTALFYPLQETMGTAIIALLYILPIGISAAFWGFGAGILSAVLAFFTFNFYFIPPYGTLFVHRSQDVVILIVFLIVTIVISQLVGRMRLSLKAATAREHEAVRLYDLMVELAGLEDEQSILDVLIRQTQQALNAQSVLAFVALADLDKGNKRLIKAAIPKEGLAEVEITRADFIAPLQMNGQFVGELRIWRPEKQFSSSDYRLIKIFINQAIITLERARLTQASTHAKILEESDRLKSSLLSSVSHELRTPLASIKAAISSLRSAAVEWDSDARQDLLALIEEETDHLNLLVGNLLNMSRIESGALTLECSWNALSDIINSAVKRSAIYTTQHQIQTRIASDLPFVFVDYILIEQVLINLINNSVKYAPKGTTIQILAEQSDPKTLLVQVTNEGPQISEEYLDRIFEKFFRFERSPVIPGQPSNSLLAGTASTGLGLSICKGIIEAHGGRIWAENRSVGIGFLFTIPIQPSQEAAQAVLLKEAEK